MADDGTLDVSVGMRRTGRGSRFELDVSFRAPKGITILFGPSGSGKSTTLQAIAGLLQPTTGRIQMGDEVWFSARPHRWVAPHRRQLAYVFQGLALFPHMTGISNVVYGMDRELPRADKRARAQALLDKLGVGHLATRKPRTFSGGEAQRVALARAFARKPRLMLLDEPFSALDRDMREQLTRVVLELVREHEIPAVAVTHQHEQAEALGDQIVRMDRGRVAAIGSYREILGQ